MLYNEKKWNAKNIDIVFEPRQFSDPFFGPKPFTVKFYEPTPPTKPMPPTKPHTHATHATHTLTLSTPPTLFSRPCYNKLLKYKPRYGLQIKMLEIVTLQVLSCSRYDKEEKIKFLIPKMKLNRIDTNFPLQVL